MEQPTEHKRCSMTDLQVQLAKLEVAHEKDVQAIRSEIKLLLDGRDKALKEALVSAKAALDLKHEEDKKHFADLNHEGQRIKEILSESVSQDVYDIAMKEMENKVVANKENLVERIDTNIKNVETRLHNADNQMKILIDNNADVSNAGLKLLNTWKDGTSGSIKVILVVGSFLAGVVMLLLAKVFDLM